VKPLDQFDKKILRNLQDNGRLTVATLAEKIGLSTTPCARRLRMLEESGVVQGYSAVVNHYAVGLPINAFVTAKLSPHDTASMGAFDAFVRGLPNVMECYLLSGADSYFIRLVCANLVEFEMIIDRFRTELPVLASIGSEFVLRRIVHRHSLPIHP